MYFGIKNVFSACQTEKSLSFVFKFSTFTEAPGTTPLKFNIPKRPYQVQCSSVSNQTFQPGDQPSGVNPAPPSPANASGGVGQTR